MKDSPSLSLRAATIVAFTVLAIFWLLLAINKMPWIVPADHNRSLVEVRQRSSRAALCLFGMSLVAIWLPIGLLGRRPQWFITCGVLIAWVAAGLWLFPQWAFVDFPVRLFAQTLGGAMLVVWIGALFSHAREAK